MIYIHNESITGIDVHNKSIERVYKGNRLVWLRNSTADSFTIVGDSSILETKKKTFRVKYAGSDDVSYDWSFTYADPDSISYNHNHRKATVAPVRGSYGNFMTITCVMHRKDRDPLTATKEVEIMEYRAIDGFTIDDVLFRMSDSSVYVPFNIIPQIYEDYCVVLDASVYDDSSLGIGTTYSKGLDLVKTNPISLDNVFTTTLGVKLTDLDYVEENPDFDSSTEYILTPDGWKIVHGATANVYVCEPVDYFTIDDVSVGYGTCMSDKVSIGVVCVSSAYASNIKLVSIGNHYMNPVRYGAYTGLYEINRTTPYASFGSHLLALTSTNGLERDRIYWLAYPHEELSFIPTLAYRETEHNITFQIRVKIGSSITTKDVNVPAEYSNIDGKYACYVFKISGTAVNNPNITFDTDRSYIVSCN